MFKNLNPSALGVSGHQSEIIELVLTYGFQGMDIDIVEFANRVKAKGMPYARRLIDSAKIRLGTFQLPLEWDIDDDLFRHALEKLPEYARVAAEIGCTRCIGVLAPAGDKRPYHENFEFHRRRFTDIAKALEPHGIRFGVGFRASEELRKGQAFQFIHEMEALSLLVNMVGSPSLGLLVDLWEIYVSGGNVDQVRGLAADQVVAVQLADAPPDVPREQMTDEHRLLPGEEPTIDLVGSLQALREKGFDGPVTLKPHRKVFRNMRRDPIVKRAGELMDQLWKAINLPSVTRAPMAAET